MADKEYLSQKWCKCCGIRLDKVKKSNIRQVTDRDLIRRLNETKKDITPRRKSVCDNTTIEAKDLICKNCITKANSDSKVKRCRSAPPERVPTDTIAGHTAELTTDSIELNIPRTSSTHSRCIICTNIANIISVPNDAYFDTFLRSNVIIPKGMSKCILHTNKIYLYI